MSKRKYKRGAKIKTVGAFDTCPNDWYIVKCGEYDKTMHRAFLISTQYRWLSMMIHAGRVFAAREVKYGD